MIQTNSHNRGVALILTLITVSAIITITLSMIGLSLQHLQLSVDARDSERAFHAASAGLECGLYTRYQETDPFVTYEASDGFIEMDCMSVNDNDVAGDHEEPDSGEGDIFRFEYEINPTLSNLQTCVRIDISIMQSSDNLPMTHDFGGQIGTVACEQSSVCTVITSRGYNRACDATVTGKYEILRELNAIF